MDMIISAAISSAKEIFLDWPGAIQENESAPMVLRIGNGFEDKLHFSSNRAESPSFICRFT